MICFNYLQQRFYLVKPTMKSLATGKNSDAIFKLIKVLINIHQQDYEQAIGGDTAGLNDIADEIETSGKLFKEDELKVGHVLDNDFLNFNDATQKLMDSETANESMWKYKEGFQHTGQFYVNE